jgi:hypothetical protein
MKMMKSEADNKLDDFYKFKSDIYVYLDEKYEKLMNN